MADRCYSTTIKDLLEIGKSYGESGQIPPFQLPKGKKNKDVCGFLSFSSGTTGLPKAVMIAHANVIAQCLQIEQITPATLRRILAVLPLFHITGLVHQLHLPILLNANVYMLPAFTLEDTLQAVQDYKLEEMLLVPPILIRMVREPQTLAKFDLSSLKRFSSGAAPLSAEILELLKKTFPGTGFKQGYGMTESCSCITAHPPSKYDYKYAFRVGTIVASTEVKIVNPDTGKECGLDEPGEIWARGPQVVMGYLNNKKATDETFDKDGFLHTGDIGSVDSEGLITISDRLKEMIKVKGIGVAPAELEDLLLGHPDVEDVAVLGIPEDYAGERPKAYIVVKQSQKGEAEAVGEALIQYVRENKVRHKWITEVEIIGEFDSTIQISPGLSPLDLLPHLSDASFQRTNPFNHTRPNPQERIRQDPPTRVTRHVSERHQGHRDQGQAGAGQAVIFLIGILSDQCTLLCGADGWLHMVW